MSASDKQLEKIAVWLESGKVVQVSLNFDGFFERLELMNEWFVHHKIKVFWLDAYRFSPRDLNRNIVICHPGPCDYFFTQKEYAILFKLRWCN